MIFQFILPQRWGKISVVGKKVKAKKREERERNVLFNDALNTFYLRLYGVRHMVWDHSDSEKGNPLPPHRLLISINSKKTGNGHGTKVKGKKSNYIIFIYLMI